MRKSRKQAERACSARIFYGAPRTLSGLRGEAKKFNASIHAEEREAILARIFNAEIVKEIKIGEEICAPHGQAQRNRAYYGGFGYWNKKAAVSDGAVVVFHGIERGYAPPRPSDWLEKERVPIKKIKKIKIGKTPYGAIYLTVEL